MRDLPDIRSFLSICLNQITDIRFMLRRLIVLVRSEINIGGRKMAKCKILGLRFEINPRDRRMVKCKILYLNSEINPR